MATTAVRPLDAKEFDRLEKCVTPFEKVCMWVPFAGWVVAYAISNARCRPVYEAIEKDLSARPETPIEAWGTDPETQRLARIVCRAIDEAMDWPKCKFIPDDPARIALSDYRDGLQGVEAIMAIEDAAGVKIDTAYIESMFGTLGDFVAHLRALSIERSGA